MGILELLSRAAAVASFDSWMVILGQSSRAAAGSPANFRRIFVTDCLDEELPDYDPLCLVLPLKRMLGLQCIYACASVCGVRSSQTASQAS